MSQGKETINLKTLTQIHEMTGFRVRQNIEDMIEANSNLSSWELAELIFDKIDEDMTIRAFQGFRAEVQKLADEYSLTGREIKKIHEPSVKYVSTVDFINLVDDQIPYDITG